MACFTDYLGKRGITTNPKSGLYINDLQGISFEKADAIADSDYATGIEMIDGLIDHSIALVTDDLKEYAMPYFKLHSIIDLHKTGKFRTGYHAKKAANRGLHVEKHASKLTCIYVQRLWILGNSTGDFDVVISDGNETTTYEVSLTAGEEYELQVNYQANRDEIYIYIDNTNFAPAYGYVGTCDCGMGVRYRMYKVYGWTGSKNTNYHYGIRGEISIICDLDDVACVLSKYLRFPILYKFGVEFMKEVQESDRLNYFTLVGREQAAELEAKYQAEYEKRMKTLLNTLPQLLRSIDSHCVSCNQSKYIEAI